MFYAGFYSAFAIGEIDTKRFVLPSFLQIDELVADIPNTRFDWSLNFADEFFFLRLSRVTFCVFVRISCGIWRSFTQLLRDKEDQYISLVILPINKGPTITNKGSTYHK